MSISKAQIKNIRSLHQSKFRKEKGLFIIEGEKLIQEAKASGAIFDAIYSTDHEVASKFNGAFIEEHEMQQISCLNNPSPCLAVIHGLTFTPMSLESKVLFLDGIKDPGNLGTLIRSADAFGWSQIVLAPHCVELYNPKVVQATMGSIFHVNVYTDVEGVFLQDAKAAGRPIIGADLRGEKLMDMPKPGPNVILVIGSESHGISDSTRSLLSHCVVIEQVGNAESLNAAIAGAILMHQWSY
jgi:TrmH family RNA methyltransferase